MINSPTTTLSILLSLKERFRSDGSHDNHVYVKAPDFGPSVDMSLAACKCGNLLTIVDVNFTCRDCRNLSFQHGDR